MKYGFLTSIFEGINPVLAPGSAKSAPFVGGCFNRFSEPLLDYTMFYYIIKYYFFKRQLSKTPPKKQTFLFVYLILPSVLN